MSPLCNHFNTEASAEFTLQLEDQEIEENESATFTCQLSNPNRRVSWMKNGEDLKENEQCHITSEGSEHSMTISKVKLEDAAEYTVKCGNLESKATLHVKGTFLALGTCTTFALIRISLCLIYTCMSLPETKASITEPLIDQVVFEEQPVSFVCKTTKPTDDVMWYKDDKEICEDDDNYVINNEEVTCTLTLPKPCVEDSGEFTVKIGNETSSAKLSVNGE